MTQLGHFEISLRLLIKAADYFFELVKRKLHQHCNPKLFGTKIAVLTDISLTF